MTSLGVYRIVQESLANIAEHASTSSATIALVASADGCISPCATRCRPATEARPTAEPGCPAWRLATAQTGADLHAGEDGRGWLVDLVVPLGSRLATR